MPIADFLGSVHYPPLGHHHPLGVDPLGRLNLDYFFPNGFPEIEAIAEDPSPKNEDLTIGREILPGNASLEHPMPTGLISGQSILREVIPPELETTPSTTSNIQMPSAHPPISDTGIPLNIDEYQHLPVIIDFSSDPAPLPLQRVTQDNIPSHSGSLPEMSPDQFDIKNINSEPEVSMKPVDFQWPKDRFDPALSTQIYSPSTEDVTTILTIDNSPQSSASILSDPTPNTGIQRDNSLAHSQPTDQNNNTFQSSSQTSPSPASPLVSGGYRPNNLNPNLGSYPHLSSTSTPLPIEDLPDSPLPSTEISTSTEAHTLVSLETHPTVLQQTLENQLNLSPHPNDLSQPEKETLAAQPPLVDNPLPNFGLFLSNRLQTFSETKSNYPLNFSLKTDLLSTNIPGIDYSDRQQTAGHENNTDPFNGTLPIPIEVSHLALPLPTNIQQKPDQAASPIEQTSLATGKFITNKTSDYGIHQLANIANLGFDSQPEASLPINFQRVADESLNLARHATHSNLIEDHRWPNHSQASRSQTENLLPSILLQKPREFPLFQFYSKPDIQAKSTNKSIAPLGDLLELSNFSRNPDPAPQYSILKLRNEYPNQHQSPMVEEGSRMIEYGYNIPPKIHLSSNESSVRRTIRDNVRDDNYDLTKVIDSPTNSPIQISNPNLGTHHKLIASHIQRLAETSINQQPLDYQVQSVDHTSPYPTSSLPPYLQRFNDSRSNLPLDSKPETKTMSASTLETILPLSLPVSSDKTIDPPINLGLQSSIEALLSVFPWSTQIQSEPKHEKLPPVDYTYFASRNLSINRIVNNDREYSRAIFPNLEFLIQTREEVVDMATLVPPLEKNIKDINDGSISVSESDSLISSPIKISDGSSPISDILLPTQLQKVTDETFYLSTPTTLFDLEKQHEVSGSKIKKTVEASINEPLFSSPSQIIHSTYLNPERFLSPSPHIQSNSISEANTNFDPPAKESLPTNYYNTSMHDIKMSCLNPDPQDSIARQPSNSYRSTEIQRSTENRIILPAELNWGSTHISKFMVLIHPDLLPRQGSESPLPSQRSSSIAEDLRTGGHNRQVLPNSAPSSRDLSINRRVEPISSPDVSPYLEFSQNMNSSSSMGSHTKTQDEINLSTQPNTYNVVPSDNSSSSTIQRLVESTLAEMYMREKISDYQSIPVDGASQNSNLSLSDDLQKFSNINVTFRSSFSPAMDTIPSLLSEEKSSETLQTFSCEINHPFFSSIPKDRIGTSRLEPYSIPRIQEKVDKNIPSSMKEILGESHTQISTALVPQDLLPDLGEKGQFQSLSHDTGEDLTHGEYKGQLLPNTSPAPNRQALQRTVNPSALGAPTPTLGLNPQPDLSSPIEAQGFTEDTTFPIHSSRPDPIQSYEWLLSDVQQWGKTDSDQPSESQLQPADYILLNTEPSLSPALQQFPLQGLSEKRSMASSYIKPKSDSTSFIISEDLLPETLQDYTGQTGHLLLDLASQNPVQTSMSYLSMEVQREIDHSIRSSVEFNLGHTHLSQFTTLIPHTSLLQPERDGKFQGYSPLGREQYPIFLNIEPILPNTEPSLSVSFQQSSLQELHGKKSTSLSDFNFKNDVISSILPRKSSSNTLQTSRSHIGDELFNVASQDAVEMLKSTSYSSTESQREITPESLSSAENSLSHTHLSQFTTLIPHTSLLQADPIRQIQGSSSFSREGDKTKDNKHRVIPNTSLQSREFSSDQKVNHPIPLLSIVTELGLSAEHRISPKVNLQKVHEERKKILGDQSKFDFQSGVSPGQNSLFTYGSNSRLEEQKEDNSLNIQQHHNANLRKTSDSSSKTIDIDHPISSHINQPMQADRDQNSIATPFSSNPGFSSEELTNTTILRQDSTHTAWPANGVYIPTHSESSSRAKANYEHLPVILEFYAKPEVLQGRHGSYRPEETIDLKVSYHRDSENSSSRSEIYFISGSPSILQEREIFQSESDKADTILSSQVVESSEQTNLFLDKGSEKDRIQAQSVTGDTSPTVPLEWINLAELVNSQNNDNSGILSKNSDPDHPFQADQKLLQTSGLTKIYPGLPATSHPFLQCIHAVSDSEELSSSEPHPPSQKTRPPSSRRLLISRKISTFRSSTSPPLLSQEVTPRNHSQPDGLIQAKADSPFITVSNSQLDSETVYSEKIYVLERLAQEIYHRMRQRIAIEKERHGQFYGKH